MGPRKTIAILLAGTALAAMPAVAQQVGTATAVNPTSQSTSPGGGTVALQVGAAIIHNERIRTTPTGTVQLLFLDKSTLSIGPNAELVIDEYVYKPAEGGHMAVSLTKGALRFVGGQLSHEGQALVSTPNASIGIRGGTAILKYEGDRTRVINLSGLLTIEKDLEKVLLRRSGFALTVTNAGIGPPERVTAAEIAYFLALLTSRPGQNGGVPGLTDVLLRDFGVPFRDGFLGDITILNDILEDAFQQGNQATQHGTRRNQQTLSPPPPPPPLLPPPPSPPPPSPPPPPPPHCYTHVC